MRDQGEFLFTSESVSEGHPDKVADRISDTVLDAYLAADPYARVACETLVTTNQIVLAGETRGPASITNEYLAHLARMAVQDIGYDQEGFSWRDANIDVLLHAQSADIAVGVDAAGNKDEGAGDQGIMFGYACTETEALMPAPIHYAHLILRRMAELRKIGDTRAAGLQPDAKSQVTLKYVDGKPVGATSIVVSTQHDEGLSQKAIKAMLRPLITELLPEGWMCGDEHFYVNPTGNFVIGGPDGDCGLTGRKIIVDTYGGAAPHGGGAFSGKDPTKVDRSAAYMCRYLAKNVVAAGLASRCTIQVSYAIGVSHPLSVYVDLHGTGNDVEQAKIERVLRESVNLTPRGIREHLHLNRPIYVPTSAYGHFGREPDAELGTFTWEKTDLVPTLKSAFGR
ncbi:MAG: methionine adenosyltransferase [Acidiphilium sp. 37-64-53]|uniref:methionine adenosyltransferase n=2 Tax=Acidocellaceae TaxID=3385905 RepID=UPI000BCE28D5|nr:MULTISPECIES: methionine adenosyltransferase [Acidiphilium]OYV63144.1 MAG: methionine adenosyltransferase [Acidiphilium sp. 21-62-4]OYW01470.1 MAG: methionine adenosyltransferase [Acidiphilium sp. 37-64-53]OZB30609.1 MAG: methionine adenosyltransferase [Acidiphilium sp. 34-64-41]HQT83913.1 methionine adenosyltransferase [Acidiphilium rubrum]